MLHRQFNIALNIQVYSAFYCVFFKFLIPPTDAQKCLLSTIIVEIANKLLDMFRHTKCHPEGVR